MAKTWIICIDGTWNQPGQKDRDPVTAKEEATPSNVVRTWEALANGPLATDFYYGSIAPIKPKILFTGVEGEAIYLAGIGTTGTVETHILEGATGTGTSERIRDAYRFLAERYCPGDRIYGFGFSRGAFAIRSLAGFIDLAGMPKQPRALKEEEILEIYDAYMDGNLVDKGRYGTVDTMIDFIGVWDTVGALAFGRTLGNFHRINPGNVKRVAHALALDEERARFEPSYWDPPATATTQVDEVWFSGCHTNIGGGYIDANLSNIALFWMLQSARDAGPASRLARHSRLRPQRSARSAARLLQRILCRHRLDRRHRPVAQSQARTPRDPRRTKNPSKRFRSHAGIVRPQPYVPKALFAGNPLSAESNPGIQPWGGF